MKKFTNSEFILMFTVKAVTSFQLQIAPITSLPTKSRPAEFGFSTK